MRIAIISDIHGNLEALEKTLKDIRKRNVDKIICLGDIIAKGVHSKECIRLVKENCDIVLQGNCDKYFAEEHDLENLPFIREAKNIYEYVCTKKYRGHLDCPCGSKRKMRDCHGRLILKILNSDEIEILKDNYRRMKNVGTNK